MYKYIQHCSRGGPHAFNEELDGWGPLIHPGHRDPLRGAGHQINGLLQQADGLVDLIIDNGLIKVMRVRVLESLRLFLQPLERFVLKHRHT